MISKLRTPKISGGALLKDFLASIVVFLVALPLCLGIALASGAPPMIGLITGMIGGVIVGALAGAPLLISGPAAGLVALVGEIIAQYRMEGLGMVLLLGGAIQAVCGVFRIGQWFRAISPAVIEGMLAGIGVLIIASQFHVMLDVQPEHSGLANIISIPATVMKGLFPMNNSNHHWAAMLGIISIASILAWNLMPRRARLIPGTLIAVVLAVIISGGMDLPVKYVTIPRDWLSVLSFPDAQSLALIWQPKIWVMALTVALVASAETMLSATAVDKMHQGPRAKYDQEMVAQGIGNFLCGAVGALPMTGVIVRSSANVQAGAQTRLSAILHGIWMLGLVSFFPHLLEMIPTASLAAILVYTGYRLVQMEAIIKLWSISRWEVAIYGVTLVMVVCTNLLEGVIAGVLLSVVKLLYTLSNLQGFTQEENGELNLHLRGSATFLSLPKLVTILERQPLGRKLHVHVHGLYHIDHACLELLENWEKQYRLSGGSLTLEWQMLHEKMARRRA